MTVLFNRTAPSGNIFFILGSAYSGLLKMGRREEAQKMNDRVMESGSYEEALKIIGEYVELKEVQW